MNDSPSLSNEYETYLIKAGKGGKIATIRALI
jgi:hypothetical protein